MYAWKAKQILSIYNNTNDDIEFVRLGKKKKQTNILKTIACGKERNDQS